MRLSRMLPIAIALTLAWTTVAAAATLRTPPFPGDSGAGSAVAACYVTNAGSTAGTVSAHLYSMAGGSALVNLTNASVIAHATVRTDHQAYTVTDEPTHCVCVVPNTTNFRCSFVYFDKDNANYIVIEAR